MELLAGFGDGVESGSDQGRGGGGGGGGGRRYPSKSRCGQLRATSRA